VFLVRTVVRVNTMGCSATNFVLGFQMRMMLSLSVEVG